jgi:class 3 adenylate cyclase
MTTQPARATHATFFFVDIVGLSDPQMSTTLQVRKIEFLNNAIATSDAYRSAPHDSTLVLPTGDGMAIGFLQEPERPLLLAIELHEKLREYNKGKLPNETIQVRIGIHSGAVFVVKDLKGNSNIWGPGIIMARRIMDIGDEGHILLSARVADDLRELSHEYNQILHPLERVGVKHDMHILVYSAYNDLCGNPKLPAKIKSRIIEFLYPKVHVSLTIVDPERMLVRHKRYYEIQNNTNHPTATVTHQIATDVDKTFDDLKIKAYDENGKTLRISSIELNTLTQKEFATSFPKPLLHGERTGYYLEYEVEEPERYFENLFLANCEQFVLTFNFDQKNEMGKDWGIAPILFEINPEKGSKERTAIEPSIENSDNARIMHWSFSQISKGRCLRLEW